MLTKNKMKFKSILKWIIISVIMLSIFIFSTTGKPGEIKPILFFPFVIVISTTENELISGIVGAISGLLVDLSCGKLIGSNAIFFLLIGVISSFFFLHLMRRNFINITVFTAIASIIHGLLDFFFYYVMWNYENLFSIFKFTIIKPIVLTTISAPIVYLFLMFILNRFMEVYNIIILKH